MNQSLVNLDAVVDNISEHNHAVCCHDAAVNDLISIELFPAEALVFARYEAELRAARFLDLGVGTGRTTNHLLPLCKMYRGIDYSPPMVEACKKRFPQASDVFAVGDARNLAKYRDEEFNFILFSYNGLDYISHEDRLRALSEIRRVLSPSGLFFFSTHSLHAYPFPEPDVQARNKHVDSVQIAKHGWCYLIDKAQFVVTHYIRPDMQLRQLADAGFETLEVLDMNSHAFDFASPPRDWMVHFLCRAT
jgi:SAM-dependent methyltransferase